MGTQRVQLYVDSDCPLADTVRADLRASLAAAHLDWHIAEYVDAGRISPTLLIDGTDVLDPVPPGRGCRLQRPSRVQITRALARARRVSP